MTFETELVAGVNVMCSVLILVFALIMGSLMTVNKKEANFRFFVLLIMCFGIMIIQMYFNLME